MQPAPSCPAPTHWWWTRVSGPLLRWQLCLGAYSVVFLFLFLFLFSLLVTLPSEIPELPSDTPVRGFPAVWRLLLFPDSLPRMGLRP